ncbi:MAG: zf-HC2 domain-containing protein [Candidatus Rokubacteria bacterium]|nr:zf-HC2 domain-containing protein [Candidatus Rokubacteria bacterium]
MTCHDAREHFSALLDEALAGQERAAVDRHLEGCAECRQELGRFQRTVALIHGLAPARAPVGFVDRVLAAARPTSWHERVGRRLLGPWRQRVPLGAAALLLVAGAAVYVFQKTPELQQAARPEAPVAPPPVAPSPAVPPKTAPVTPEAAPAQARPVPAPPAARSKVAERARDKVGAVTAPPRSDEESRVGKKGESQEGAAPRAEQPATSGAAAEPEAAPKEQKDASRQSPAATVPAAIQGAPEIMGRLAVADRAEAMRALTELAARVGASEASRPAEGDESFIELWLPREAYPALVEGLGRIGRWTVEREPTPLPARLRIGIRLTG